MKPDSSKTNWVSRALALVIGAHCCLFAPQVLLADSTSVPIVVYGQSGQSSPRYRVWSGSSWGSEQSMATVGAEPYWVSVRNCPVRDEYCAAILDKDKEVHAFIFNGSSWSQSKLSNSCDDNTTRGFDVAYEQLSGDAMVAYFDVDQKQIAYYTWSGSTWSGVARFSLPSGDLCPWLGLYADKISDRIMLVALHKDHDLSAIQWDGASWGSWTTLETDLETDNYQCFDFAWESSGGQGVVVYSQRNSANPRTRTWNGSSWSSESSMSSIGADAQWVRLVADPASDEILCGTLDSSRDINVFTWSASSWAGPQEIETSARLSSRRMFDIAYESGETGKALIAYNQNSENGRVRYRTWNGTAWSSESSGPSLGEDYSPDVIALMPWESDSEIMLAAWVYDTDDGGRDLRTMNWNGTSLGSNTNIETSPVSAGYESFWLASPVGSSVVPASLPYMTDFESGVGPEWSNTTTTTNGTMSTFLGRFNEAKVKLAVNTTIGETYAIQFDFYAIDSWDGDDTTWGPDKFRIVVNGAQVFEESFSYLPETYVPSFENPAERRGHYGYNSSYPDSTYRVTVTFTATSSVSTITFSDHGVQDLDDESWGIDNVSVTEARFVDVSTAQGFDVATTSDYHNASGLHWFDADGDGDLDAILGGTWSQRMVNNGTGFTANSFGKGNERRQHAIFDVDNDGDVDFWSGNHDSYYVETCFRNDGSANFSDIGSLGFSDPNNNEGVAAADVNRDGWCDIVHFCENDNWIGHHQGDPGASLPSLVGTKDSSYGLSDSGDHGNGDFVSAGDVNNDGYLDFFYHYSGGKLFVSDGDGTYTENVRGINVTTGNSDKFGSAWADYDNDGDLDLYCARWDANQKGYLWRNNVTWAPSVSGTFSNQSDDAAINDESGQFGCAWGDYDNDGDLDLYVATRSGPNKLYQNQGNGTFRMVDEGAGVTGNCQDVVFVDYDNDGDLDIAVTREDDKAVFLENRTNNDNYLKVRVIGQGGGATNTAAIGVRVELWNSAGTQLLGRRDIGVARGLGTEPLWAHFGGVDPTSTYQVRTYLHSRDNSDPLVSSVVPQSVSTTIGSTVIPQMLTITEVEAKKQIKTWREVVNRS